MESLKGKKIAIAIALQQHSYKTAEALQKNGLLYKYYTTVFYNEKSLLYKLISKFMSKDLIIRMKGKKEKSFEKYVIKYYELIGLIFLFLIRKDKSMKIALIIRRVMNKLFGKKIAKRCIKENIDLLIMYDTLAYDCFKSLEKKNAQTKKVLDMASIAAPNIRKIIIEDLDSEDIFTDSLELKLRQYSEKACRRYEDEIKMADYFLVACMFSKKALVELGVPEKNIFYLPLGIEVKKFKPTKERNKKNNKLKFLFVGRVEAAKGIYYLLEAFKQLNRNDIELDVVGSIKCDKDILSNYSENINFIGVKRKEEMPYIYSEADVYILSSLWEGFSLSLFEALSCGLPVIATDCSCAPDVITNGKEGFVVRAANIEEIKTKILWFIENRDKIEEMGENSRKLANQYTWEKYNENLNDIIFKISNDERN